MKEGHTHLTDKAEHGVDLDTGGWWRDGCEARIRATRTTLGTTLSEVAVA